MNATATHARSSDPRRVDIDPGRWVSIRPIERSDAAGLSDFYASLSRESRRRRFLGEGSQDLAPLIATFTEAGSTGLVGVLREPGARDGIIVAHASVQPDGTGGGEVAFAVADALQGHGAGRVLTAAALDLARSIGLTRVSASLFADNAAMRHLLHPAGCSVLSDSIDLGVEELTLGLVA